MNVHVPRPYHRGRMVLSVVFLVTLMTLVFAWPQSHDDATGAAPAAPKVKIQGDSVLVSWQRTSSATPTSGDHDLRIEPPGYSCTPNGPDSCIVRHAPSSVDLRFAVRTEFGGAWTPWSALSAEIPRTQIVIIAGQSNATGWEAPVTDAQGTNVLAVGATEADQAVRLSWDQPKNFTTERIGLGPEESVSLTTPQTLKGTVPSSAKGTAIFGPEITLARRLYASGQRDLLVLKVTQSGTQLGDNGPWSAPDGSLYKALVADAKYLLNREASHGRLASVVAINWYQGENDSKPGLAEAYQRNLTTFITSLRSAIPTSAATPFVIAMTSTESWVHTQQFAKACAGASCDGLLRANEQVRAADRAVAGSLGHVGLVDTVVLPHATGGLHLNAQGELTLGTMLADTDLSIGLT